MYQKLLKVKSQLFKFKCMIMKILEVKLPTKALRKKVQIKLMMNCPIQPFRELPPVQNFTSEIDDRMNAHDLFSKFTADIIMEDTVFTR